MILAFPTFFESGRGLAFLGFFFWLWMIYDCAKREKPSTAKIFWLLFVIFVPDVGALVYFLFRVVKING
jgi:hypothetical protein